MCEKNRAKEHITNKYEPLTKDEKQKQKYDRLTKRKNIKIIKNNIEKIRSMNKTKK